MLSRPWARLRDLPVSDGLCALRCGGRELASQTTVPPSLPSTPKPGHALAVVLPDAAGAIPSCTIARTWPLALTRVTCSALCANPGLPVQQRHVDVLFATAGRGRWRRPAVARAPGAPGLETSQNRGVARSAETNRRRLAEAL